LSRKLILLLLEEEVIDNGGDVGGSNAFRALIGE
jgi:hypothetical protein